jgi:hypothetical protein
MLSIWERKILRKIYVAKKGGNKLKVRNNQELKEPNIIAFNGSGMWRECKRVVWTKEYLKDTQVEGK